MGVVNLQDARAARARPAPGAVADRPRGTGPVAVVDDVDAMLVRLARERRRVLAGGDCCIVVCRPDDDDRIPRTLALRESAARFARAMRSHDAIFHYGADRLLLCLPHVPSRDAVNVMARLRRLVCETPLMLAGGRRSPFSVTLSGAMMTPSGLVEDTVDQAERGIRSSLAAGGNRVCMLMPEC